MRTRTLRRWALLVLFALFAGFGCKQEPPPEPEPSGEISPAPHDTPTPTVRTPPPSAPLTVRTVHHGQELTGLSDAELAVIEELDLALSSPDQVGRMGEVDPTTTCDEVDLLALAPRLPALNRLRVSGCQAVLHAGLGALGTRLATLELADIDLDAVIVGRLTQLAGLRSLTLTRVRAATAAFGSLRNLALRELRLSELEPDSELASLVRLWPRTLVRLELDGAWAGHQSMEYVPDAAALERLALNNTRIGNFSLNQIRGLTSLREVSWSGRTFNDRSPLYIRDLPITSIRCACPDLGDGGLRNMRRLTNLRQLELVESDITDAGVQELVELEKLEVLALLGRDLGPEAMTAIGSLESLTELRLGGVPFVDPKLEHLGGLQKLRVLELDIPNLRDEHTAVLAQLTGLRELRLGGTGVSDATLGRLGKLPGLERLELHHTRVTRDLGPLASLRSLRVLELDHTDVVDDAVNHLARLSGLEELRLDATLITDAAVEPLLRMTGLRRLNVSGTVLSPDGVTRLRALPALEALAHGSRE